jgi:tetratricopeptide (TPR) repeat protein
MGFARTQQRAWLLGVPLLLLALAAAFTLGRPAPANAGPYLPKTDAEVLETLPGQRGKRWLGPAAELAPGMPLDSATAVARARAELTHYQESADPRHLGRAEAALGRFWDEPAPPVAVLVLRARIRQSNHEFLAALSDLDRALALNPREGQALLDRASIRTVLGRHDAARSDCQSLEGVITPLYVAACRAAIAGVTGSARAATGELSHALLAPGLAREDKCWAESLLGELSTRLGDSEAAEAQFRRVLIACPNDSYAKGALADLLLDLQRNAEVVRLLADQVRKDALLLRLTIAERQLNSANFRPHLADLTQRFEEARLRGSSVHRREEARFELAVKDDPARALTLALENFQVQREPADVRLALEAALAAGHPERAREVVDFARASQLEDPRVGRMLERFPQ